MPVLVDSKRLLPVSAVTFERSPVTAGDGRKVAHIYQGTIRGSLLPHRGSPDSTGALWDQPGEPPDETVEHDARMGSLLRKQDAIVRLFRDDGKLLEVTSLDGLTTKSCNIRGARVSFQEGVWVDRCDYTVTFETDRVFGFVLDDDLDANAKVTQVSEEWNLDLQDEIRRTYRLTHVMSAAGKRYYLEDGTLEKEAWEQARDYVLNNAGLGLTPARMIASGVVDGDGLQAFNYLRSQAVNEDAGSFSVNETWTCFDPGGQPPAVHEQTVNVRYGASDGRTAVSVDGSITGLEQRNTSTQALVKTRWANASEKWESYVRPYIHAMAVSGAGIDLNPTVMSIQVGRNQVAGTITYQYEYDDRPDPTIPGALSQSVSITQTYGADVFADIAIPGRAAGPILQPMGTRTARRKDVSLSLQMPAKTRNQNSTAPSTDDLMISFAPSGVTYYVQNDTDSFDENSGRYSRNTTFVWTP